MASKEEIRRRNDDAFDELDDIDFEEDEVDEFDEGMRKSPEGENPLDSEDFQRVMADTIVKSLKSKRTGADSTAKARPDTSIRKGKVLKLKDKSATSSEDGSMSKEEQAIRNRASQLRSELMQLKGASFSGARTKVKELKAELKFLSGELKKLKGAK
tara:strand:- start:9730 stop:10200 length:471 start_codon:yes stop_codon:yes gene_type:complete